MNNSVTGIILAGGLGTRMGGQDKGLVHYLGQPLIKHALGVLQPQVSDIIISCNRNVRQYQRYGYRTVQDQIFPQKGPLAGVINALPHCQTTWAALMPVDAATLPAEHIAWLLSKVTAIDVTVDNVVQQPRAIMPNDHGQYQPLFSIINTRVKPSLHEFLLNGGRSAKQWLQQIDALIMETPATWGRYRNINTNEQLNR